jgi:hypothetical protein
VKGDAYLSLIPFSLHVDFTESVGKSVEMFDFVIIAAFVSFFLCS